MRFDPAYFRHAVGNQAPIGPFALNRASRQADGLVAWWPFQPGAAAKLLDLADAPGHAVIQDPANVTHAAMKFGAVARNFPGSGNNDVIVPDSAKFDLSGGDEFTICLWLNPLGNAGQSSSSYVFSKRTAGGGAVIWAVGYTSGSQFFMRFQAGGVDRNVVADATVGLTGWHHLVVTRRAGGVTADDIAIYLDGVLQSNLSSQNNTSDLDNSTRDVWFGSRDGEQTNRRYDGLLGDVRLYNRFFSAADAWQAFDPTPRWGLYREIGVPRVWPKAAGGGAVTRTAIGSLQAALQRQDSFLASSDAVLSAEAVLSALAGAALGRSVSGSANLDLAVQVLRQAQADLDTVLTRSLGLDAGLDANLATQGASQRAAVLDAAIRRLNLLSGALEAALRAPNQDTATLDAWLAMRFEGTAGLDAVARRGGRLSSTALQGILRATPSRATALDAIIGLVVAAAVSRTQKIGARGGHMVPLGLRQSAIPSSNRRH